MEENKYSVKDLCNIFQINANTFPSIAKRLNINTEEYCKIEINEFNSPKKYYNEFAYKKIEEYIMSKEKNKTPKDRDVSKYLQKIEDKEKTISDLRHQLDFTQKLLISEKGEKQQLQQQIFLLSEDNKRVSELEADNKTLLDSNGSYIQKNHELEQEKYDLNKKLEELKEENSKLKNRGLFARIFNRQ